MKSMRLVAAAAFLVLAACSSSATEPAAARPSFNGINTMGSGGYSEDNGGGMMGPGNDVQSTGTAPADTIGRGGNTLGSGN